MINAIQRRPMSALLAATVLMASAPQVSMGADEPPPPSLNETVELKPYVVTAPRSDHALEVTLDAKVAYQPMPAQDGADYLKNVPGFSVIRKGGTDGDPVLRGMAGSRLGISLDGQAVLGGCASRMDPPTAYVFPAAYDRVTILKGPQSVRYGPGASAGVVRFESDLRRLAGKSASLDANVTAGSFGRLDAAVDGTIGVPAGYARVAVTRTESGDYEDGAGNRIHSSHMRWSSNVSLGWTPNDDTILQYSMIRSDGEAAYADRMMDGTTFDRESHQIRFGQDYDSSLISRSELEIGYNYIDHVMDNYSLRSFTPTMMMANPTVSNPDRRTVGGRGRIDLTERNGLLMSLGLDFQNNRHSVRNSMNQELMPYQNLKRIRDAEFMQYGLFGEASYRIGENRKLHAGLRLDNWEVDDLRETVRLGMMGVAPNPTAGQSRSESLYSGFARYEATMPDGATTYYAGLGRVSRFLDYWELIGNESASSVSAFSLAPEVTTQLDIGATRRFGDAELTVALFASDIDHFALVESGYAKPVGMMGSRAAVITRGIDARTVGGEAALSWRLDEHWLLDASLAYTQGKNRTDDLPLAQVSPLESRLSLNYTRRDWSLGGVLRAVSEQNRVAVNQGNIVGQDIGETPGFAVFSLNGSWHINEVARLSAGVDNAFDKEYAEHTSRSGSSIPGYVQTTRVNEPGRTFWARLDYSY